MCNIIFILIVGCDEIKRYLLDMVQQQRSEAIEDDEQARSRLENAPKVYTKNQVVNLDEIGQSVCFCILLSPIANFSIKKFNDAFICF